MAKNASQIILKNVRFAFAHVFEPDDMNGKYSVRILIPKNSPQIKEIAEAIKAACEAGADKLKGVQIKLSDVLHDGDDGKHDESHAGHYFLNAKSTNKPGVVKVNNTGLGGKTTEITDPREFYSGCYGWASVGFFAFNQKGNQGISVGLNNLLKTGGEDGNGNGSFMGGRVSAEADFGSELDDDMPEGGDYEF